MGKMFVAAVLWSGVTTYAANFTCTPTEVAVFQNRIHVRCAETHKDGTATIRFWAVPTTDDQWANRFLSTTTTALVSGRKLVISFTPGDKSGTQFGCLAHDCRKVLVITIR